MATDFKKLGFKCGIEIHQQLLTDKKLFCRCPAGLYSKTHDAEVLRHMRPTLSEMGVYDGCALMEFKTKKDIIYLLNKESVCTYEMDDTPPFPINQQALDVAIELALLCGCSIVDEIHIARKQYLDGSIPTGFQRTGIVGINGSIPFEGKEIGVTHFSIEEDACREVTDEGHLIRFRTDRLGMPLIEVVTTACFETPEEAARGVRHIGRLLRSSKNLRRGIGHVRQDVNVSIRGGRRVEIKGVPRYQDIPDLTAIEALRQKALLDIAAELARRGLKPVGVKLTEVDLTDDLRNTQSPVLRAAIDSGHRIAGAKLEGFGEILNYPTQPGLTFASELTGRVRVIACLDGIPNIYHTDNYPEYLRRHIDLRTISQALDIGDDDVGVITWGPQSDIKTALNEIRDRLVEAFDGVPNETRQHLRGGITTFERILPGADRMYPDTDHPPLRITADRVERIRSNLPEPTYEIEERFLKYGIPKDIAQALAMTNHTNLIDRVHKKGGDARLLARLIVQTARALERDGVDCSKLDDASWTSALEKIARGDVKQKDFKSVLTEFVTS